MAKNARCQNTGEKHHQLTQVTKKKVCFAVNAHPCWSFQNIKATENNNKKHKQKTQQKTTNYTLRYGGCHPKPLVAANLKTVGSQTGSMHKAGASGKGLNAIDAGTTGAVPGARGGRAALAHAGAVGAPVPGDAGAAAVGDVAVRPAIAGGGCPPGNQKPGGRISTDLFLPVGVTPKILCRFGSFQFRIF